MPHTVPNRPTNGAVEPTVASTDSPPVSRLWISSTARLTDIVTQLLRSICSTMVPSWCLLALTPRSAMYQNGVPLFSAATPSSTLLLVQNLALASLPWLYTFCCSISFMIMMYQVAPDMISMMISTSRATTSPCAHSADRSEEHTSELPSLMRISYAVFCLQKKKN